MKKNLLFAFFLIALFSCKSTKQEAEAVSETPAGEEKVITYVNTSVNKADGKISTILTFKEITEVTLIHPLTRERWTLERGGYSYNTKTTELKISVPKSCPHSLTELGFHIVGQAENPGVFVLAGMDFSRGSPGIFFEGREAVLGKDYSYESSEGRVTSLVPLNVDKDSFEICWATRNGEVTFSNNTTKHKDAYQKLYRAWKERIYSHR